MSLDKAIKIASVAYPYIDIKVFIVGETITPAMRKGDLLIAVSGSGKTTWVVETVKASKSLGGKVTAITWDANSELARLANIVVLLKYLNVQTRAYNRRGKTE